jgi:hypothetical protein
MKLARLVTPSFIFVRVCTIPNSEFTVTSLIVEDPQVYLLHLISFRHLRKLWGFVNIHYILETIITVSYVHKLSDFNK